MWIEPVIRGAARLGLVVAVLTLAWASSARAELRLALVIGNAAYAEAPLAHPVNDAHAVAKALRALGFDVIGGDNLTLVQMTEALGQFTHRLDAGALAFVYYAGYGVQMGGKGYLLPVDAVTSAKAAAIETSVSVADAVVDIAKTPARASLVVLDAAREHPAVRRLVGIGAGLPAVKAPRAMVVAFAAAPGQTMAEGGGTEGSYAAELAQALKSPGVPVDQVFDQVRTKVAAATGEAQVPWVSSGLTGAVYLTDPPAKVDAAPEAVAPHERLPVPVDADAQERALWLSVKDSKDAAGFETYLAKYPTGRYATLARNGIRLLQQKSTLLVPLTPPAAPVFQPPNPTKPIHDAATKEARQQFDKGLGLMRSQDYDGAETAFRRFLIDNPTSPLVGNALYWLGESFYVRGRFVDAASIFGEVSHKYSTDPRAAEATLKLGLSQAGILQACKNAAAVAASPPACLASIKEQKQQACETFGLNSR